MNWMWIVAAVIVLAVFGWYLGSTAGRLDRLHRRIEMSELSLEAQLLRRSAIAIEIASAEVLDPISSDVVANVAHEARLSTDLPLEARIRAESALTVVLIEAFDDPEDVAELRVDELAGDLLDELEAAIRRVELSRRFHDDAVLACQSIRRHRIVRWFSLAGHTPWPLAWGLDDRTPLGLTQSAG